MSDNSVKYRRLSSLRLFARSSVRKRKLDQAVSVFASDNFSSHLCNLRKSVDEALVRYSETGSSTDYADLRR